ncbi:MAG: PRC-barrel domain-containing protein [Candidatus Thermoplasmatota archaeon]
MEQTNDPVIGKTILNSKGTIIGMIHGSIKDGDSGKIVSVLLVPSKKLHLKNYSLTKNGEIVVPFSSLSTVKDAFIIEEPVQ